MQFDDYSIIDSDVTTLDFKDSDGDTCTIDLHKGGEYIELMVMNGSACMVLEREDAVALARKILEVCDA
nr:MAG: hypothetical protein [Bacteriophage sp.]